MNVVDTLYQILTGVSAPPGTDHVATKIDKNTILNLPCDILVPAAIGGVITEENADQLDCKFVVEAANGPTTPDGDAKLRERGITVLPDIYTNGGKGTVLVQPFYISPASDVLKRK